MQVSSMGGVRGDECLSMALKSCSGLEAMLTKQLSQTLFR